MVANQRVVYVSGAYRASTIRGIVQNIRHAENVAIRLWTKALAVICPHTNTRLFDGIFGEPLGIEVCPVGELNAQNFIVGDIEMLKRLIPGFDVIVMLPGYKNSKGAMQELKAAEEVGLIVHIWDVDDSTDLFRNVCGTKFIQSELF